MVILRGEIEMRSGAESAQSFINPFLGKRYYPRGEAVDKLCRFFQSFVERGTPALIENGREKVYCKVCSGEVWRVADKDNLVKHFKSKHPGEWGHILMISKLSAQPQIHLTTRSRIPNADIRTLMIKPRVDVVTKLMMVGFPINKAPELFDAEFISNIRKIGPISVTTLRRIVPIVYSRHIKELKQEIGEGMRFNVIFDGTSPDYGRKCICVLIQRMDWTKLIGLTFVDHENSLTIQSAICDSLQRVGISLDSVGCLVSDAARKNISAFNQLSTGFPNIRLITCIAHALHGVAMELCKTLEATNILVFSINRFFSTGDSVLRRKRFQEFCITMRVEGKLLQKPSRIRWGTFISFVLDLESRWDVIKSFISGERPSLTRQTILEFMDSPVIREEIEFIQWFGPGILSLTVKLQGGFLGRALYHQILGFRERIFHDLDLPGTEEHGLDFYLDTLEKAGAKFERYFVRLGSYWNERSMFDVENMVFDGPSSHDADIFTGWKIPNESMETLGERMDFVQQIRKQRTPINSSIQWWDNRRNVYPYLSERAINMLWRPVSSAAAERTFSILKLILRKQRNRLTEDNVRTELLIKFNQ